MEGAITKALTLCDSLHKPQDRSRGDPSSAPQATVHEWLEVVAHWKLSPSQDEALHGVFHGLTFQQIADSIHRSRAAIDSRWRGVKTKTGAESITDAIHKVYVEVVIPMRIKAAVDAAVQAAVAAATDPLLRQIEELENQIKHLEAG